MFITYSIFSPLVAMCFVQLEISSLKFIIFIDGWAILIVLSLRRVVLLFCSQFYFLLFFWS